MLKKSIKKLTLGKRLKPDATELRDSSKGEPPIDDISRRSGELNRGVSGGLQRGSALPRGTSFSMWLNDSYFLCINVKEGVNLPTGVKFSTATCDPYVRVTLQRPGSPNALAEAETRILKDIHNPMWEECLPLPLDDVSDDVVVSLRVLDEDLVSSSFIGSVTLPIKEVLSKVVELGQEHVYRLQLQDRNGVEGKRGTLVFGVSILQKQQFTELNDQIKKLQSADQVHAELHAHQLHMRLHGLRELGALAPHTAEELEVGVSLCSFKRRLPLKLRGGLREGGAAELDAVELVVPLGQAFAQGSALRRDDKAEFGEIKIELLHKQLRLAKTQIPIWDVPFRSEAAQQQPAADAGSSGGGGGDAAAAEAEEKGGGAKGFLGSVATAMVEAAAAGVAVVRGKSETSSAAAAPEEAEPAAPAPPPLWDGRRYERRMDLVKGRDRGMVFSPLLLVSMQLAKPETGGDEDDVNEPTTPLAAPAPLDTPIADFVVVGLGPHALFRTLFGDNSELADKIAAAEKLFEIKTQPWGPDPDGKAMMARGQTYKKPAPMGATASVEALQKVLAKCDGGFVLTNCVMPMLPPPAGHHAVHVHMQVVGQHAGPGKTRVTVTMKIEWLVTGWKVAAFKGAVDSASPADAQHWYRTVQEQLKAAGHTIEGPDGGVVAEVSAPAAAAAAGGGAAGGGLLGGAGPAGPVLLGAIFVFLLFLLLALLRVGSALGRSAAALEAVSRALAAAQVSVPAATQQACAAAAALR